MSYEACDILVRGGTVVDGTGAPGRRADLAIRAGRVYELGVGAHASAPVTLEAQDALVAPGFIDIHGHSDFATLITPDAASRVAAGVTTEVMGQCGYGAFPLAGEVLRRRQAEYAAAGLVLDWSDLAGYLRRAGAIGCAINRVPFVGYGNVRGCVVGYGDDRPSPAQLAAMAQLVEAALAGGCWGLSTGLIYPPGMWADTDELATMAAVLGRYDALYASHVRSEGERLLESVDEFLAIITRGCCRGQFSHVKTAEPSNWPKIGPLRDRFEAARRQGLRVWADRYPYTASATDLESIVLPNWARQGSGPDVRARLTNPAQRARLLTEIRQSKGGYFSEWLTKVVVTSVGDQRLAGCVGRPLADLPALLGPRDPLAATFKLLVDDAGLSQAVHHSMSPENLREIYRWPFVAVGSDSSARDAFGPDVPDRPHPRAYGTPARFVELVVRQWGLMDWPQAIRRMTGLPAEILGLSDRGTIRDGAAADLVILEPDRFADQASYESPCCAPTGVRTTLVNGQVVWHHGHHSRRRPGRILLRPRGGEETARMGH